MSNLRRQSCQALADAIAASVRLQQPPTVISAPPSDVADYPTVAMELQRFKTEWGQEDELGVDSTGQVLTGAVRDLSNPAGPAEISTGVRLSVIGNLTGRGRIWVGCRLPPAREDVEDLVVDVFKQDTMAPGRLLATIDHPKIGAYRLPWSWTVAFFCSDAEWNADHAFSERLWSYVSFDFEVAMLAVRTSPMISQLKLALDAEARTYSDSSRLEGTHALDRDVAQQLADAENYLVAADGTVTVDV